MKKTNETLNALKGIACILVVFIHVQFPGMFGDMVVALSRSAVALFFVISGYYLYNADVKVVAKKLPRKIKSTAIMTGTAFLLYFIWECFVRFIGTGAEKVFEYIKYVFDLKNLIKVILTSYDPVVGHLWFLLALLGAYILLIPIIKFGWQKTACYLAIPILELHIVIMALSGVFEWNIDMTIFRSVLFYGLPFVLLGYWARKSEEWINKHIKTNMLIIFSLLGTALVIIERLMLGNLQIFNGTIIFTMSVFLLAVRYPDFREPKALIALGGKYSSDIYVYHWLVMEIVIKAREVLSINIAWFEWVEPILVFGATLLGVWALNMSLSKFKCLRGVQG